MLEPGQLSSPQGTPDDEKRRLGQYMTPPSVAAALAKWFTFSPDTPSRLLDAGAGAGSLSLAFADHWAEHTGTRSHLTIDAYEIDPRLHSELGRNLASLGRHRNLTAEAHLADFTDLDIARENSGLYTHAFLNPPYVRVRQDTNRALQLNDAGFFSFNLYGTFISIALRKLAPGGTLVAIVPRSFCNGRNYRALRDQIFAESSIRRVHVIDSRTDAFKHDGVIQENVVIELSRASPPPSSVLVSFSKKASFEQSRQQEFDVADIVDPNDPARLIRLPDPAHDRQEYKRLGKVTLSALGLRASTGPVVDFRTLKHISSAFQPGSTPLVHAHHITNGRIDFPNTASGKNNSIAVNASTRPLLMAAGNYVVVRRFSSKEQPRRIVSAVVDSSKITDGPVLGFENHLNVIRSAEGPLHPDLAWGLSAFLNSYALDPEFRALSGSTQVNASDLSSLRYPRDAELRRLGRIVRELQSTAPEDVDGLVARLASGDLPATADSDSDFSTTLL